MATDQALLAPRVSPVLWAVSAAVNVLSLALPLFVLLVYDRILPNSAHETLVAIVTGLVVLALFDTGLRLGRSHILNWSAMQFEHQASLMALDHLLDADREAFVQTAPGTHLDRLRAIQALRAFHGSEARLQMMDLPFAGIFFLLIWAVGGWLVLVPVAVMGVLFGAGALVGHRLRAGLARRGEIDNKRQSFLIEVLDGLQSIKARQMESLMLRRFERLQAQGALITHDVVFYSQAAWISGAILSSATFLLVGLFGAARVIEGGMTIGELAAATLLSGRAVQPMLSTLSLWTRYQSLKLAEDRLAALFSMRSGAGIAPEAPPAKLEQQVRLIGVSYRKGGHTALLRDIDLDIRMGEITGITGPSRADQDLLLSLIAGELRPTEGTVLYDDLDLAGCAPAHLAGLVAHVPAVPVLFRGTILQNISMFRGPSATGAAIAAARTVGLDRFVNRLPRGYDTEVGTGADDALPPGVRRMLTTARALATRPGLLLLNQADNSLDHESDAAFRKTLTGLRGRCAVVVVSHRPSTLALADHTFTVRDGRLRRLRTGRDARAGRGAADKMAAVT